MTSDRHARVQELFLGARDRSGPERARYLDEACGGDEELRRDVEELLAFDATSAGEPSRFLPIATPAPAGAGPFAPGSVVDGKIRIEGVLGEGGMGTVFRGVQLALERPVAVKVIRPSLARVPGLLGRLRREALAIARLRHPNVVAIYDFCTSEEAGAYLVMELVEGESLADRLARETAVPPAFAADVMRQICDAVQAAHDVGIIHRDLKPPNILLESAGRATRVKVLDFGIAKLLEATETFGGPTTDGAFIGTPLYVSPEQASGLPVDARSDVYALGCILYELLTGRPPFVGPGVGRILAEHAGRAPKPPSERDPGLPAWLDGVALRALAKLPEERYQSAAALADALAEGGGETRAGRVTAASTSHDEAPPRVPNNLPTPVASFVGREDEVAAVVAALETERLVTLTGPGGVGKSRLAVRAASEMLSRTRGAGVDPEAPGECRYVDLAGASSPADVPRAIAAALGLRAESDEDVARETTRRLSAARALLVLDNVDRVAPGAAAVANVLLAACPDLRVLATGRVPLHAADERAIPVSALRLPPAAAPADAIEASEAVALFVERAREVAPSFRPTGAELEVVADVCRRLDGLPLAIELAAARARVLTAHQIRDRLRDRMRLLASSTTEGRHVSLRAAFDWSYDLLGPGERLLFDRLSVFAGGFTIDAIEGVCAGEGVDEFEALDTLAGLADKSLVAVEPSGREARYRLLASVRDYAAEKLAARGEAEALGRRHRDHFLKLAETAAKKLHGKESAEWNARLRDDLDNLRAALAWSRDEAGDGVAFLRLATAMHVYFYERGLLGEGRAWIDEALARAGDAATPKQRTSALTAAGNLAHDQGDLAAARAYHERALAIDREAGNESGVASALHNIGNVLVLVGDYEAAREHFAESLEICRRLNRPHNVALSLFTQASVAVETGETDLAAELFADCEAIYASLDYGYGFSLLRTAEAFAAMIAGRLERFERLAEEALERSREVENPHNVATIAAYRANVARHAGRHDEAEAGGEGALAEFRALGDKDCTSMALFQLARSARQRGDRALAARRLADSLAIRARLGLRKGLAECYEETAALAVDALDAARMLGAAGRLREEIGAPVHPIDAADRDAVRAAVRDAAGDAYDAAFAEGAALAPDDAAALARRAAI